MMAQTSNPSPGEGGGRDRQRQGDLCEFEASLTCTVSSRTIRSTVRDPVPKNEGGGTPNITHIYEV